MSGHNHASSCLCASCGAETESLLESSGQLGKKLDEAVLGNDPGTGGKIQFRDIRRKPFRLPWAPRMTLIAGVAPIMMVMFLKFGAEVMSSILPPGGAGNSPIGQIEIQITGMMPTLLGGFLVASVVVACVQFLANARYVERQAWLDRLADVIDRFRAKASAYTVCSYCNSLHKAGEQRQDATPIELRKALSAAE